MCYVENENKKLLWPTILCKNGWKFSGRMNHTQSIQSKRARERFKKFKWIQWWINRRETSGNKSEYKQVSQQYDYKTMWMCVFVVVAVGGGAV